MPFINYIPPPKSCNNMEHYPPGNMVLPGGTHTWQCPSCGETMTFYVTEITCKAQVG